MTDIVMVTYNRKDFTDRVLYHLATRTVGHYRLIVVDNGSTDGTQEVLAKHKMPID
jgi:glycosyltransferase involved in cell wall biosynthesis